MEKCFIIRVHYDNGKKRLIAVARTENGNYHKYYHAISLYDISILQIDELVEISYHDYFMNDTNTGIGDLADIYDRNELLNMEPMAVHTKREYYMKRGWSEEEYIRRFRDKVKKLNLLE